MATAGLVVRRRQPRVRWRRLRSPRKCGDSPFRLRSLPSAGVFEARDSASGSPGPARPGAEPTRISAASPPPATAGSTAASRPMPDGISRRARGAPNRAASVRTMAGRWREDRGAELQAAPLADHARGRQAAGRSLVAAVRRDDRLRSTVDLQAAGECVGRRPRPTAAGSAAPQWTCASIQPLLPRSTTGRRRPAAPAIRTRRDWRVDRAI